MDAEQLIRELQFKAIRSSGPGGQHVNKASTKVEVQFNVEQSEALSEAEKLRLSKKLENRINSDGFIVMQCGDTRSQHRNKAVVIDRIIALLTENLKVKKKRKKSKPSRAAIEKRLKQKKQKAIKKSNRKRPNIE